MIRIRPLLAIGCALGVILLSRQTPLAAQSPLGSADSTSTGPINIEGTFTFAGTLLHYPDGIIVTSPRFNLKAQDAKVYLASPPQHQVAKPGTTATPAISRMTADGDPAKGVQVTGRFEQIDLGRSYRFRADHLVYQADTSRPGGGSIDLTGHVHLIVSAPQALAEPAPTDTDHATLLLGPSPDYPVLTVHQGHTTFVPLQ